MSTEVAFNQTTVDASSTMVEVIAGKYYKLNGQYYDIRFPLHWATNSKCYSEDDGMFFYTGPEHCLNCRDYGSYNGVFIAYCLNCAISYKGDEERVCVGSDCDKATEEEIYKCVPFLRGIPLYEIGDARLLEINKSEFLEENAESEDSEELWKSYFPDHIVAAELEWINQRSQLYQHFPTSLPSVASPANFENAHSIEDEDEDEDEITMVDLHYPDDRAEREMRWKRQRMQEVEEYAHEDEDEITMADLYYPDDRTEREMRWRRQQN